MGAHQPTSKQTKHNEDVTDADITHAKPASRGQNEGIGTENNPHGAVPGKKHPNDFVKSEPPQEPASTGPRVADVDAPILEGHQGESYETVYLTAGPDKGVPYRVATPLPQVVVYGGQRYLRSTHDTYVWQVP